MYLQKKSYSKPLEHNADYIPIITVSHMISHDLNDIRINQGSLQSDWMSAEKLPINICIYFCNFSANVRFFIEVLIKTNVNISNNSIFLMFMEELTTRAKLT